MTDQPTGPSLREWYLGAQNDALFIIDHPPSPSGTDVPPGIYPNDPDMILNVAALTQKQAQAIVDAHNASLYAALAQPTASLDAAEGRIPGCTCGDTEGYSMSFAAGCPVHDGEQS